MNQSKASSHQNINLFITFTTQMYDFRYIVGQRHLHRKIQTKQIIFLGELFVQAEVSFTEFSIENAQER